MSVSNSEKSDRIKVGIRLEPLEALDEIDGGRIDGGRTTAWKAALEVGRPGAES